ncbi:Protein SPA1-RELATED 3 [Acorus calamus]|uniref:Protein SPA1-RELATED 3 n=1 Tax=Acorus calamus TaxID=4465 RepID=A0AAV9EV76_ACOCL|nr:Protein SPA1-RELATED 3 [Acorus calamus]
MAVLTSVELNYLVFRYLQESGFTHSAFAFGYEAGIHKSPVDGNLVPPAALVKFVQKGLQYLELEANLSCNEADVEDDFSFIEPFDLITKDVNELRKIVNEKKAKLQKELEKDKEKDKDIVRAPEQEKECEVDRERQEREREQSRDRVNVEKDRDQEREKEKQHVEQSDRVHEDKVKGKLDDNGISGGPEPMDIVPSTPSLSHKVPISDVTILEGHNSEVFACAWSPDSSLLASGSGDSTARIWPIPDGPRGPMNGKDISANAKILKHFKGKTNEKCKDVTTLEWNVEGTLLATGSYDGQARIWTRDGELRNTLNKHRGPVFSLKWNKKGDFLLTGSVDRTAIVWDVKTGDCKQQFDFHTAPTLDVDWRNNVQFATGSTDYKIYVCKVGENRPIKTFLGHEGEVNSVKWDPTAALLASCSDDRTVKIWSLKQDKFLHDLREHSKEIYTIRWSPTGPSTSNPNQQLLLASASFDSTVKLWNVEHGVQVHSLEAHRQPVYAIAFSPNGEYLASGSLDQCIHIWSVKEGKVVKTYTGNGGIFEVCWNREGDRIAACFSNSTVCVLDLRM